MTAEFEVRRKDGKVAVSSVYQHYAFIKKMRVDWNTYDTSGQQYSDYVIVAFIPVDASLTSAYRFAKGSQVLWHSMWDSNKAPPEATLSLFAYNAADAYIFDVVNGGGAPSSFLRVYNEEGECTFDASRMFMRIVDVIQDDAPMLSDPWGSRTSISVSYEYPTFTKLAVIPLKEGYHASIGRYDEQMFGVTWQKVQGTTVSIVMEYMYENAYSSRDADIMHLPFTTIVVDVSHIDP